MKIKVWLIVVMLGFLLTSGCTSPKASPTATPTKETNPLLTFTFRDGTCEYDGPSSVEAGMVKLKIVIEEGNQDAMDGVAVITVKLREGKTISDLQAWPSMDKPPWADIVAINELFPGPMEKEFSLRVSNESVYFVCFHPEAKIGALGPVEVQQAQAQVQDTQASQIVRAVPTRAPNPIPVAIDTDMAADDWMAILYLLNRTDIEIDAITVTGAGEAHCEQGVSNALKLIKLAGKSDIPVACGLETPLAGNHTFPQEWRVFADSLAGKDLPVETNPNKDMDAVTLLQSILEGTSQKVTLLTLGPLTNIAELLSAHPQSRDLIQMIFVMGGAYEVPGNVGFYVDGNESAEWNIYIDPKAASEVLSSGVPVTLVPLDATNQVPLEIDFYDRLEMDRPEPEASFVFDVLTGNMGMIQSNSYYFWDPLAAAIMVNESFATFETNNICVETDEGNTSGATEKGNNCPEVRIAVEVNADLFEKDFIDTLNAPLE